MLFVQRASAVVVAVTLAAQVLDFFVGWCGSLLGVHVIAEVAA